MKTTKPREWYIEFHGNPNVDDKENYKRYVGAEPFNGIGPGADVIHVIEKSAADALAEALEFSLHCVKQTPWIAEGPGNIKDPMFLGTGSVEGDKKVHSKYLSAKQALKTYSGTK